MFSERSWNDLGILRDLMDFCDENVYSDAAVLRDHTGPIGVALHSKWTDIWILGPFPV